MAMLTSPATVERSDDFLIGKPQHFASLRVVVNRHAGLRQPRMQINRVRHDCRADDTDREQKGLCVGQLRHEGMYGRRAPIDRDENISTT